MKPWLLLNVGILLLIGSLHAKTVEEIYFLVNGKLITKMDFELYRSNTINNRAYREALKSVNVDHYVLSNMMVSLLVEEEMKESGTAISELDISNQINQMMQKNNIRHINVLKKYLKEVEGLDYEYFYETQKGLLYMQALVGQLGAIQEPNENEIKEYYEKNKQTDAFMITPKEPLYKLSVIFFSVQDGMSFLEQKNLRNTAESVLESLQKKTLRFEDAAKTHSDDLNTKNVGGRLGWVFLRELRPQEITGGTGLSKDVQERFLKAKKKELIGLVSFPEGFYIYSVEDIKQKGVMPYMKAHRLIKNLLISTKRKEMIDTKLESLFETSAIDKKTSLFKGFEVPHHKF